MIKIVLALPSFRGGGAERVMVNIANNLDKDKFDVNFIVLSDEGPYKKKISQEIKLINLNTYNVRKSGKKIIDTINYLEPDVILTTHEHLNLLFLAIRKKFKNAPKIITRLTNAPPQLVNNKLSIKNKLTYQINKILINNADKVIAQCDEMKRDYIDLYRIKEDKITYIYNPLEVEKIKNSITSKSPYNDDKINFLAVGRLAYQKGFDILLKSFAKVGAVLPNSHLTILGTGDLENELKQLAKDLKIKNRVTFAGYVDNPYNYYYYSDLYILSSRFEGFPNSLLEALACNTKVVATRCKSGPTEILKNEDGMLVEVNNVESLADGILAALEKPIVNNNRAKEFDVRKIVKNYENVIVSALHQ